MYCISGGLIFKLYDLDFQLFERVFATAYQFFWLSKNVPMDES